MKIAVVTGASSGMGKEFVLQLDRQKAFDEIWVIARRFDRLQSLQSEVKAKIRPISLDLTREECIAEYRALLDAEKPVVDVLVNASGVGRFGAFADMDLDYMYRMIDLNSKAYVGMTHATLPYLAQGSEVYQLDSLSSFQPVPYIGVYGATKAFVLSFSRALNVELKSRKIRVMAVCPGWVKTEFFDRAETTGEIKEIKKNGTERTAKRDQPNRRRASEAVPAADGSHGSGGRLPAAAQSAHLPAPAGAGDC